MTRTEYTTLTDKFNKLQKKRSQLQNELSELENQKRSCYKDKLLTGNEDAKKLTGIEKRIKELGSELPALDDLILQAQSEIDPVAAQLVKIRAAASKLLDLKVGTPAWREYLNSFINPLHAELDAKLRLADSIRLELLRDDFQNLDNQVKPIQEEISNLEAKLAELRSNPALSAHRQMQNSLINLNQKMKHNDLYVQMTSSIFNNIITEYTR